MSGTDTFDTVQRIVIRGGNWACSQHLAVHAGPNHDFLGLLFALADEKWPTPASVDKPPLQVSLGLTRRGLQAANLKPHLLTAISGKAPAFTAGAALRATHHAGGSPDHPPTGWDEFFAFNFVDAVISVHADTANQLELTLASIEKLAESNRCETRQSIRAARLPPPPHVKLARGEDSAQWVHFGLRDGLARMVVPEWTPGGVPAGTRSHSIHRAGEFVLGHPQDSGANPWIAGPKGQIWPPELRQFFNNGSFGVLHQIQQFANLFEGYVKPHDRITWQEAAQVKAVLCGRTPEGVPLAAPTGSTPDTDFDYEQDDKGLACPFGSHIRRMNPRTDNLAHGGRKRTLLRRGMPYGQPWTEDEFQPLRFAIDLYLRGKLDTLPEEPDRGLMAHFFCASIEDQFEHLLGQWADRVPMGSADPGRARDPFIGAHQTGDGPFAIPQPGEKAPPKWLRPFPPFTRTRGTVYLFYPSTVTFQGVRDAVPWIDASRVAV